jgi:hypothetical protein
MEAFVRELLILERFLWMLAVEVEGYHIEVNAIINRMDELHKLLDAAIEWSSSPELLQTEIIPDALHTQPTVSLRSCVSVVHD